ncbi:MAG: hypothetical protein AB1656_20615 [Candidatus Omnitrophota bacterium]
MNKTLCFLFLLTITAASYGEQNQLERKVILPMMKDGSPAAYVSFGTQKITHGLAMAKPEGTEFATEVKLGFLGVKPADNSSNQFLSFQTATDELAQTTGTLYVSIQFFDEGKRSLEIEYLSAKDKNAAELKRDRLFLGNSKIWQEQTFMLTDAILDHSLPGDSDFLIYCGGVFLRNVALSRVPLGKMQNTISPGFQQQEMTLPPGFLVGVYPSSSNDANLWKQDEELAEKAKLYPSWGTRNVVETIDAGEMRKGRIYDFTPYSETAQTMANYGLNWVPRFKIGDTRYLPTSAIEKLQKAMGSDKAAEGPMISLWDDRLILVYNEIFSDMQRIVPSDRLPLAILSFAGDWGPLFHSSEGTSSSAGWPDFWAGDPLAVKNYQDHLRLRYGNIRTLSAAWNEPNLANWNEIKPVLSTDISINRRLDTLSWYQSALSRMAGQITERMAALFPRTKLVIEIGDEFQMGATDIAAFVDIAIKNNASLVMITKEPLPTVSYMWLLLSTECRRKNVSFGLRLNLNPGTAGILGSLYSLASEGGSLLFFNEDDLAVSDSWNRYANTMNRLRTTIPLRRIAALFPRLSLSVESPAPYDRLVREMRDRFAFDVIDESDLLTINSNQYPLIFSPWGNLWSENSIAALQNLVRAGSALVVLTDRPWRTPNGNVSFNERIFAAKLKRVGSQWTIEPRRNRINPANDRSRPSSSFNLFLGTSGDNPFLTGDWSAPIDEEAGKRYGLEFPSFRFAGKEAGVVMNMVPRRPYRLEIEGFLPQGKTFQVFINRKLIDTIAGNGEFQWDRIVMLPSRMARVELTGTTWSTGEVLGATQTIRVGMAVSRIAMVPPNMRKDSERFDSQQMALDFQRGALRGSWLRELGRGVTFLSTNQYMNEGVFMELISAIAQNPMLLDPRFRFAIPPDSEGNNIFVSQQTGTTVYLNRNNQSEQIARDAGSNRRIALPPASLFYAN